MPEDLVVQVTVTQHGNSLLIEVDNHVVHVRRHSREPVEVPIRWSLNPASSAGAQLTGITFPWPAPPLGEYTFTEWAGERPAQQPNGHWRVTCHNNHTHAAHVYHKYHVHAAVGSVIGELDPIVDNHPPPDTP